MVDRVAGLALDADGQVKSEFNHIHGAEHPVTVSRSGARWDGYTKDPLTMGEVHVECSLTAERVKPVSQAVKFDPESSLPYQNYKAVISEMAGLVYKWPQLHTGFMKGLAEVMNGAYVAVRQFTAQEKPKSLGNDDTPHGPSEYVSSNPSGLNHKDKVRRHGW